MNKKAALFHWVIFGILAALGLFLILTVKVDTIGKYKGEWQLNFLNDYYLEAEEDILSIELLAKHAAWKTVLELGEKGGFLEEGTCGITAGYNLWNNQLEWNQCLPDINENFVLSAEENVKGLLPNLKYSKMKVEGNELSAKGPQKSITSTSGSFVKYVYDTSFHVNLGFNVEEEFLKVQEEAFQLVTDCQNMKNVSKCVEENKKENWKLKDCQEEHVEDNRKVPFCVLSSTQVFNEDNERVPLQYKFALDFNPTEPFKVEGISVEHDLDKNIYKITFKKDDSAESYNVYFTNDMNLAGYTGKVEDVYILETAYFLEKNNVKSSEVIDDESKCVNGMEVNKAYLCNGKVIYPLSDELLVEGESYLFTVTSLSDDRESEIDGFVLVG